MRTEAAVSPRGTMLDSDVGRRQAGTLRRTAVRQKLEPPSSPKNGIHSHRPHQARIRGARLRDFKLLPDASVTGY
jgi:hypothetical protein